jgi:YD repeat-containing protein
MFLNSKFFKLILVALCLLFTAFSQASDYKWRANTSSWPFLYDSPQAACDGWAEGTARQAQGGTVVYLGGATARIYQYYDPSLGRICGGAKIGLLTTPPAQPGCGLSVDFFCFIDEIPLIRVGDRCPSGKDFNKVTGTCGDLATQEMGQPPPESCIGNPINIAVGNKFQQEIDYKPNANGNLAFIRYYNSMDGLWRHNYSTALKFHADRLSIIHADGRESLFSLQDGIATADPNEMGKVIKSGSQWTYTDTEEQKFTFDGSGRLIEQFSPQQGKVLLSYVNSETHVADEAGKSISFSEDYLHQPLSFTAPGLNINYTYDSDYHLTQVARIRNQQTEQRTYHYEDSRNWNLLTGITDERGIRFATWAYDNQGRAIRSWHAGRTGIARVVYNSTDGTNVVENTNYVINALGKQTFYEYKKIAGVNRIMAIKGEPSPNCPASNSSYTYNDRGAVLSKTDAKGFITTYTYNDRGLETTRTEASGTPQARVTTTEWDPNRFLRTKVVEPTRTTVYTYDDQGRETGRQVSAR